MLKRVGFVKSSQLARSAQQQTSASIYRTQVAPHVSWTIAGRSSPQPRLDGCRIHAAKKQTATGARQDKVCLSYIQLLCADGVLC
jgi:hypothetical protein